MKNTYEVHLINKENGELVKIIDDKIQLEICEGVSVNIMESDFTDCKTELKKSPQLTKEQSESLKKFIQKMPSGKPLSKKEIVKILDEIRKPRKKETYRQSGHFIDRKLEYDDPNSNAPSFFDLISLETKEKIEHANIEIKTFGIKLSPAEDKLINAILKLLHDKSEHNDIQSPGYYGGNENGELINYGGNNQQAKSPWLRIRPTELYKEYLGTDDYSGKDILNIKNILHGVSEKKFLILYDRKRKVKMGKTTENRTDRIEDFQNLIKIISYIEDLTDKEIASLDSGSDDVRKQKGELIIALNPLLTDQINSKYVEYPTDINRRTVIASGGHLQVTESILALRDYMLRELSAKRFKPEINADKLPYVLKLDKYVKSYRKKIIADRINAAIKAVIQIGIILNFSIVEGSAGQQKYIFSLNSEFQ